MKHPYKNVCDKYEENDFKRFKRDFLENFELENTKESKERLLENLRGIMNP